MQQGLQELNGKELTIALEQALLPRLKDYLTHRADGHCMRVSNLSTGLMVRLCSLLRSEVPEAEVAILWDAQSEPLPDNMGISATKLVELRNPLPNEELRPPLLVFIPDNLRTSAEDSFGVATFEEVQIGNIYEDVSTIILERLPKSISQPLHEILRRIKKEKWVYASSDAIARFLLTIEANGAEASVVGAALFELGLVPDFELLTDAAKITKKIERNLESVRKLTWSTQSERQRLLELGLEERTFRNQLSDFLVAIGLEDPKQWTRRIVLDRSLWKFAFNRWKFEDDDEETGSVCITITDLGIPVVTEEKSKRNPRLASLIEQKVLATGKGDTNKFSITFSTNPYPSKVNGLTKFVAQIISEETGAPIGLVRNKTAWKTKKAEAKIPFNKYQKFAW
ncbi:MAG: ATP-binding protein, partial [Cyanobacteria bacterium J06649_4]